MPTEVDEFGIPIKKQPKQKVDEFGIPVKKKESTQPSTSSTPSQPVSNTAPVTSGKPASGLVNAPNNNVLSGNKNPNTVLNQAGIGVQMRQNFNQPNLNTQGDVLNNQGQSALLANVPRKSQYVAPIGNPDSEREFNQNKLNEIKAARDSELSYMKTEAQKSEVMKKYEKEISSYESKLNSNVLPVTPITNQPKKPELVKPENIGYAKLPEKKELGSTLGFDPNDPNSLSNFDLDFNNQGKLFEVMNYNAGVSEAENIIDIDEEELRKSPNFTPEQVNDILLLKQNTVDVLGMNIPQEKKVEIIQKQRKDLDEKLLEEGEVMQLQNDAATEGRSVSDLLYDEKKLNKDMLIENILNNDVREHTTEYTNALYELKDLMTFLTDKKQSQGKPLVSFDEQGNVVLDGFKDEAQKAFYTQKIDLAMKKIAEIKKKSYNVQQDKITKAEQSAFAVSNSIKQKEAYLAKMDKNSPMYQSVLSQISEDKKQLSVLRKTVTDLKNEGNILFSTNPNEVSKSIISQGGKGVKSAFSSLPDNLSSKEKFDLAYKKLLKTVQRQEQELGIDPAKTALMIAKDLTIGLSPEELEYRKNKMALSSMTPMYLMNESGLTNENEDFISAFTSGLANWITPNMTGGKTQTNIAKQQVQSTSEVGLQADYSKGSQKALEERADGPEGIWNQEFWGETTGLMAGIVLEMVATGALLKIAKIGRIGQLSDEIYSLYQKSMESTKLGRFFMPIVNEAAKAEVTGQIFQNAEDELNFENFLVGGTAAKALGTLLSSIPASKKMDVLFSVFGSRTKDAVQVIKNRAVAGAGEVVQEFGEELSSIYNDELRDRGFWEEVSVRFGDVNELEKFIVSSFLMGSVMHGKVNQKAQDELNSLPEEQRARVEQIINESIQDLNSVNTDIEEVVSEEVSKSEVIEEMDKENIQEEPIAPTEVIEEVAAENAKTEDVKPEEVIAEPVINKEDVSSPPITEEAIVNNQENGETVSQTEQGTGNIDVVGKDKGQKTERVRDVTARKDDRAKQARNVEHSNPRGAALKYFIEGGKINSSAVQELFGSKPSSVNQKGKKITGEYKARLWAMDNKKGKSIDDIAHQLWEENNDVFPNFTTSDYKNAIQEVMTEYTSTQGMVDEILSTQEALDKDINDYYQSIYGPESIGNEDYISSAESFFDNLTPEQQQRYVDDFESAQKDFESQFDDFESKSKPTPEKKIKKATSQLSKKIRELKAPIDLSGLSSSPKPLFDAAWNTAIEAAALTVEATGSIAQAVSDGVKAIKETEWYKGLSDEGKSKAEEALSKSISNLSPEADEDVVTEAPKKKKKRKLAKNIIKSDEVTPETKEGITDEGRRYIPIPNTTTSIEARDRININGTDKTINEVLNFSNNMNMRVRAATAIQLIKILDKKGKEGDPNAYIEAGRIAEELSKWATELGQAVQVFSLWDKMSAEGILTYYTNKQNESREKVRKDKKERYEGTKEAVKKARKTSAPKAVENVFNKSSKAKQVKAFGLSESDIAKRKKAALEKINKSRGTTLTSGGLNSEMIEGIVEYGAMVFADGVRTFKEWVVEMKKAIPDVSEKDFETIWNEQKSFGDKTFAEISQIGEVEKLATEFLSESSDSVELSKRLQESFGLDVNLADGLASELVNEFTKIVKAEAEKELKKKFPFRLTKKLQALFDEIANSDLTDEQIDAKLDEHYGIKELSEDQRQSIRESAEKHDKMPEGFLRDNAVRETLSKLQKLDGIRKRDVIWSLWYASILSGHETQLLNIASNVMNIGMESMVTSIQKAVLDKDPKALAGFFSGMAKGFTQGYTESGNILASGQSSRKLSKKLESKDALENIMFKGGNFNPVNWAKYVSRFMFAIDSAAYLTTKGAQQEILARELAQKEGLSGVKLQERVSDILNDSQDVKNEAIYQATTEIDQIIADGEKMSEIKRKRMIKLRAVEIVNQKIPDEVSEGAGDFAAFTTFNYRPVGSLGVVAGKIQEATEKIPVLRLVVPFTGVVANVLNQQLDYTPYGYVRSLRGGESGTTAKNKRERQRQLIKATMGTMMWTGIYLLAKSYEDDEDPFFAISGKGPSDYNKKSQLLSQGWRPYSIKIGNTQISYQYSPFGLLLASLGNYMDSEKYKELDKKDVSTQLVAAVTLSATSAMEMSFLSGLSALFSTLSSDKDPEKKEVDMYKFVGKVGTSFIPNALKQLDRQFDPTVYERKDVWSSIMADIPIAKRYSGLRPQINAFGEPIEKQGNRFFQTKEKNKVWDFMAKHNLFAPGIGTETQLDGIQMTPDQLYEYARISGQKAKQIIETTMPTIEDWFKDMDQKDKNKYIQSVFRQAREEAKYEMLNY